MLDKHCTKVSEGLVWGLIPAADGRALALEIRNKELKTVQFGLLTIGSADLKYLHLSEPTDWWTSIKALKEDIYLFSRWQDPLNPALTELWAFDNDNQKVLWKKSGYQFVSGQLEGFWAVQGNFHQPIAQLFDWKTGHAIEGSEILPQTNQSYILPLHYTENERHFDTVKQFIKQHIRQSALVACDYLEWDGHIFISYYCQEADSLANFLLMMGEDGKILLNEKLESDLKAVGVSTFFIFENHLIFVRNKAELFVVPLKSF